MNADRKQSRFSSGKIITYAVCSLFLTLTVLFFSPLEVMLLNIRDFHFSFDNVWWVQLLAAVVFGGVLTLIAALLPRKGGMVFSALLAGNGLAAWIQMMFLNGGMDVLTGEDAGPPLSSKIINAVIWGAVILCLVLMIIRLLKYRTKTAHLILRFISCVLTVVQSVAFVSLAATTDTSAYTVNYHLSVEGLFELGRGTNVVEIILDTADVEYVEDMLGKYPELRESLSGWVYYPNATSAYSRTYPAITYLLSGSKCYFDLEPSAYVDKAYRDSDYLKDLKENGTDIRVFSMDPEMVGEEGIKYVANGKGSGNQLENLDYIQLEKNLTKISLYKCMPYLLKSLFEYKLEIVNISSFRYQLFDLFMDPYIYEALKENGGITVSDKYQDTLRFYHLWSAHPGAFWDSNLVRTKKRVDADVLRGSFRFVEEYIASLKQAGIYDRTLLIVTADHGWSGGDRTLLERNRASCPLLMVKYPGSDLTRPMITDRAPVAHDDLFGTINEAFSCGRGKTYGSGKTLRDFHENDDRVRYHYYSALDEDNYEVALLEYAVEGDATDFSTWRKTGKYWDIRYSLNPVSDLSYRETQ